MSRKFLTPIDLQKNELQNARIQNLSGAPASPVAGQVYYDSGDNILYYYNGSGWINAGGMTAGLLSARPAAGSGNVGTFYYATDNHLIYYSDGATWAQVDQFGSVANLSSSSSNGSSTDYARADHVHRHANTDHSSINISALAVPTANTDWGGYKITNHGTPTATTDVATKGYVDSQITGLTWKAAVNLLSTTNVALTGTTGSLVIDGHTALDATNDGYRILLTGQSTAADKGIYTYSDAGSGYTLARSTDADTYQELISAAVFVEEGTAYGKTMWVQGNHYLTSFSGQSWTQFGAASSYSAGNGITLTGNVFSIVSTAGTLSATTGNLDLATVSQSNSTGNTSSTIVQGVTVDTYGRVTGVTSGSHTLASTTTAGIASFSNSQFTVTAGAVSISALSGGVISGNISGNAANVTGIVAIANGGTGATTASGARSALSAASSGANSDITSLSGLTTALSIAQGGTGATTAALALTSLGAAQKKTGTLNFTATTTVSVNHALGQWVTAQTFDGSGNMIDMDVQNTSTASGTTIFTVSATSASATNWTYVIVG